MDMADQLNLWGANPVTSANTYDTSVIDSEAPSDLSLQSVNSSGFSMGLGNEIKAGASIFGAWGDIEAGDEEKGAYDYNANLALTQGQFEVSNLDTEEADTLSTQRATYAKAGVTMSGSPLDTAVNTASQFEMDKQVTTYNAQSKANMDEYEGRVAKQQGEMKAGMSLLGGAADIAMLAML